MTVDVRRPCGAADLVALTPPYSASWGPPLPYDPVPWRSVGGGLGFDHPFVVRDDSEWSNLVLRGGDGIALRYVLVPLGDDWELRSGRTQAAAMAAETGGIHRYMFSTAEQQAASKARQQILSGYIYEIVPDHITVG